MNLSKVGIIARREYLTTVRRKAFVFTLFLTPAIFLVIFLVITKAEAPQATARQSEERVVALVDSSGVFENAPLTYQYQPTAQISFDTRKTNKPAAPPKLVPVVLRRFADQKVALDSLEAGTVKSVFSISTDFLKSGRTRI